MPKKINVNSLKLAYSDGRKVNQDEVRRFVKKLEAIAKKTGGASAEDFLSIMIKENSLDENNALVLDQWSDKPTNKTGGHARGLIQFVPSTAKGVGLDQDKLSKMTATEQLDYVEKYFSDLPGGLKKITDYKDVYLSTFHPAAVGKGDDYVISSVALDKADDSTAYSSNKGVDIGEDGVITNADFAQYAQNNLPTDNVDLFQEVSQEEYDLGYPAPDKIFINSENVLIQSGENKGKYKTTYTLPDGTKKHKITRSKAEIKPIGNNNYLKTGDSYYSIDNETGLNPKKLSLNNVHDNEYNIIKDKVKSGQPLSNKEYNLTKNISSIRNGEIKEKIIKRDESGVEGFFRDTYKKGTVNIESLSRDLKKNKESFFKEILVPNEQANMKVGFFKRKEDLAAQKETLLDVNKSSDEMAKAREIYNSSVEEFKKYSDDVNKSYRKYKNTYSRVGERLEGKGGGSLGTITLNDDMFSEVESAVEGRFKTDPNSADETTPDKPDLDTQLGGGDKKGGSSDQTITTPRLKDQDDNNVIDNPEDFTKKEIEKYSEFIDTDALQHQIDLDNTLLADLKSQKPIDDEVVEGDEDVLGNALGYGSDIARGIIGLSGATEKLPEYERGEAFNEYLGDARAFKAQGLTALEESVRKQRGERAYGFDVANIRNMGQGAGATLAAMGGAANRLQDRYATIGLEDAALKRQGRSEFARAALSDEQINRQQFEDKFKISMANKEAGAGLVRDAYTNLNERVAYNEAYGKGSQQYQYMNELTRSMKTNRELLKRGAENRKREGISSTEEAIRSNTDKRNKAIKARNVKK